MDDWRKRLEDRIDALGLTLKEVSVRADVNPTMLFAILRRGSVPSVDNLAKIAKVVGMSLSALYEGKEDARLLLRLDGVTTGAEVWAQVPPRHSKVVPVEFLKQDTVSIEVTDDGLAPRYDRGDILSGPTFAGPHLDNTAGCDCIIELMNGTRTIGIVLRGRDPGLFTIRSINPRNPDLHDVAVRWAAPIRMILRGRS